MTVVVRLLVTTVLVGSASLATAAAPPLVAVDGYLTDSDGKPLNGATELVFALYVDDTTTAALFTETHSVSADHGVFQVLLGSVSPLDLGLFAENDGLYLGLAVNGDAELEPRLRLASVPYAAFAQTAGEAMTLQGLTPLDLRLATEQVAWSDVSNVPSALADGGVDWSELSGVPSGLLDDDDDLLASLSCVENQVAQYIDDDGTLSWACVDVADLALEEAAIDGFVANNGYLTSESDPDFAASAASGISDSDITAWDMAYAWGNHSSANYLTSETDPEFSVSAASGISASDITTWNTAYGWGDHASANYLTSETDPEFSVSAASGISAGDISVWDAAYGWGDHASAGYALSSDLASVATSGDYGDLSSAPWSSVAEGAYTMGNIGIGNPAPSHAFEVYSGFGGYGSDVTTECVDVTESSALGSFANGWKAFDDTTSDWATASGVKSGWVRCDFGAGNEKTIRLYTLTAHGSATHPADWTFEGSNDDSNWTVLDTKVAQGMSTLINAPTTYSLANSTAYRYYRLNVSAIANPASASWMQLEEMEMMEGLVAATPTLVAHDGRVGIGTASPVHPLDVATEGLSDAVSGPAQLTANNTWASGGTWVAQTFVATSSGLFTRLRLHVNNAGSGQTVMVTVHDGATISASGLTNQTFTVSAGWNDLDFSYPPLLAVGNTYTLQFLGTTGFAIAVSDSGPYAEGLWCWSTPDNCIAGYDAAFEVFTASLVQSSLAFSDTGMLGVGTSAPAARVQVADGDVYLDTIDRGVIMTAPDGTCWRLTVGNGGSLATAGITCP